MENHQLEYPSPKPFLRLARLHQRRWLENKLGLESSDEKRVRIPSEKAYEGLNFFNTQVINTVSNRFPKSFIPDKNGNPKPLICDALRSEHIPFNLFSPLMSNFQKNGTASFFSHLANTELTSIDEIKIEYADPAAQQVLKDKTKFDAYVFAWKNNRQVVLCIEVKYTEGPYPWGTTEKKRMFDVSDEYIQVTNKSSEFKPNVYKKFRNKHLKQIWRNYLLGIITSNTRNCDYIYIHLFPKGNEYQSVACEHFQYSLTDFGRSTFRAVTYEDFIDCARGTFTHKPMGSWIEYIENRYLVNAI